MPINVTNGNTWIAQQDYSIPGLAGGLKLTRTWNSLWSLTNPPEQAGIFGNSWRSTFEERIQSLSGGVVKYWKSSGSSLFYTYNSFSGAYNLTAPLNDQTSLSFDSVNSRWIVTEKNGTQRIFNNAGYLTSIVDLNGNTITINADANNQNRIASVTDASGRVLTFNYANASYPRLCTSISDSVGTFTTYNYDFASGRLTQVVYPDGSQLNYQYNSSVSNTLISKVTDSLGKTIEAHTYDSQRRGLTSQQANDSSGRPVTKVTITYGYPSSYQNYICDSTGNYCVTVTISNVAQRHYLTQTNGSYACSSCEFPGSSSETITNSGYSDSYIDPNGNRTFSSYDTQGNVLSRTLPKGSTFTGITGYDTWNYTYNSLGQVLTTTDPLGQAGDPNHTTTNSYDNHGNILSVTTASPDGGTTPGSVTSFTYNSNGTLATITDPLNHTTTINYCPSGQSNCPLWMVQSITDANNKTTSYTYDGRGNRLSVQDPVNTNPMTFTYDAMNRVTSITYPDLTSVQFHYDYRGRRDWVQDQNGKRTTYAYDDADRLLSVTDAQSPTAGVTTYAYDTESHVTDIWDAAQNHTHITYNGPNPQFVTFPSGYQERYSFTLMNQLSTKTDRIGNRLYFYYDYQNRVTRRYYPDLGTRIDYSYDGAARLTQVTDMRSGTDTYTFGYDNMGRLTSATTRYGFTTFGNKTVQYAYDAASNRTSMADPQNAPTTYGYDNLNRLTSLIYNNQTPGFTFGYDDMSRRNLLTRPNGINTTYGYDAASHLLSVLHQLGTTVLDGATYTYDNAGNRTTRTDQRTGTTLTYGYDNIYQLLSAMQGTTTTESYTYDLVGNRLSSLGVSPYTYNSSNELVSIPSGSYTYDNNGNTKTKPDGTQFTWDLDNELTQVVLPGTGGTVNFKYDPFGRRIQKAFTQGSTTTTTNYLYDGENLLEEVDQNGSVLARYTHGPFLDQPLSMLRSATTSYYEQDGLYSVTSLSDSLANLASTNTYDSFGKLTASTGSLINPYRFAGRELDSESGSYFNRARYYSPDVGRFLSEDPIRFSGGINFYAYAVNRPTLLADAFGLAPNQSPNPSWWQQFWNWMHGPPKPKPPNPIRPPNLCEPGQTRLFSEAGPNPYNRDGHGEERWAQFQDAFIDKCLAATTSGKETIPYCSQGAGVLGPFAYCDCCERCSQGGK
jgi:RHS repeat-associated protein